MFGGGPLPVSFCTPRRPVLVRRSRARRVSRARLRDERLKNGDVVAALERGRVRAAHQAVEEVHERHARLERGGMAINARSRASCTDAEESRANPVLTRDATPAHASFTSAVIHRPVMRGPPSAGAGAIRVLVENRMKISDSVRRAGNPSAGLRFADRGTTGCRASSAAPLRPVHQRGGLSRKPDRRRRRRRPAATRRPRGRRVAPTHRLTTSDFSRASASNARTPAAFG
jgi:hypothetical protein